MLALSLALLGCEASVVDTGDDPIEDCHDGQDNDADGAVDCQDADCREDPTCQIPTSETDCNDGVDNDQDGLLDCEDADCVEDAACFEDCADGVDNNWDGFVDCQDPLCVAEPECPPRRMHVVSAESLGGTLRFTREYRYYPMADTTRTDIHYAVFIEATGLAGELIIGTASDHVQCDFGVAKSVFRAAARGETYSTFLTDIYTLNLRMRTGFTTSGACGGVGSGVLPRDFAWQPDGVMVATTTAGPYGLPYGPLWIDGGGSVDFTVNKDNFWYLTGSAYWGPYVGSLSSRSSSLNWELPAAGSWYGYGY